MAKRTPKYSPTPHMVDRMLGDLLKPLPFWKLFGKEARERKIYAKELFIGDFYNLLDTIGKR